MKFSSTRRFIIRTLCVLSSACVINLNATNQEIKEINKFMTSIDKTMHSVQAEVEKVLQTKTKKIQLLDKSLSFVSGKVNGLDEMKVGLKAVEKDAKSAAKSAKANTALLNNILTQLLSKGNNQLNKTEDTQVNEQCSCFGGSAIPLVRHSTCTCASTSRRNRHADTEDVSGHTNRWSFGGGCFRKCMKKSAGCATKCLEKSRNAMDHYKYAAYVAVAIGGALEIAGLEGISQVVKEDPKWQFLIYTGFLAAAHLGDIQEYFKGSGTTHENEYAELKKAFEEI